MNTDLEFIVKRLVIELMNRHFTIATAEECTCGLIGASIASQDFPQRWYKGTITTYTQNEINKVFGISNNIIEKNGLVSSQIAQQMALETLYKFNANITIGVVGDVDGYCKDVQICVCKKFDKNMNFAYKKITVDEKDRGKNLEIILNESLSLALEHIMED